MPYRRMRGLVTDQRGIALPLAMLTLLILSVLIIGFVQLSTSEPVIANNQLNKRLTLALAEAGVENAMWALNNPADPMGIPLPVVPPRYNSPLPHDNTATFIAFGIGGYTITVTPVPGTLSQAQVTATGWSPTIANFRSKTIVQTTVESWQGRFNPPAAVNVQGSIAFSGGAFADGTTSLCGVKAGTLTLGNASFIGASGALGIPPSLTNQPMSAFAPFTLSQGELNALKAAAKATGTYYQGAVGLNPLPNGLVFVDTVSGNPIGNPPVASDLANVTVNGANSSGWLIVMGSISITGNVHYNGLIYAADALNYHGTGNGGINGAVIALNVTNPVATTTALTDGGNSNIKYDCNYAHTPPGGLSANYFIVPGTWKTPSG
jgi:hypothetical protein